MPRDRRPRAAKGRAIGCVSLLALLAVALLVLLLGGNKAKTGLGRIDPPTMGEVVLRNVPVHTLDIDPISAMFEGLDIRGIIGTRLVMHFLSTVDYPGGALVLRPPAAASPQALASEAAESDVKTIPLCLVQTHYIVDRGSANSPDPMLFFVDTGPAGAGFAAPLPVLEEAGVEVDWAKAQDAIGGGGEFQSVDTVMDRLALGTGEDEVVKTQLPGTASEHAPSVLGDTLGCQLGGLISHQFFRDQAVTFCFTGMRLIMR